MKLITDKIATLRQYEESKMIRAPIDKRLENWEWRKDINNSGCYLYQKREDNLKVTIRINKILEKWEIRSKEGFLGESLVMMKAIKFAEESAYKLQEEEKLIRISEDDLSKWFRGENE